MWRQPQKKTQYDWYTNGWCKDTKSEELFKFLDEHLSNQVELQYEITESDLLIDEHWHVSCLLVFFTTNIQEMMKVVKPNNHIHY